MKQSKFTLYIILDHPCICMVFKDAQLKLSNGLGWQSKHLIIFHKTQWQGLTASTPNTTYICHCSGIDTCLQHKITVKQLQ